VGDLRIDARATKRGSARSPELTALEFAMLHTLARHADQVLSREQLLEQVWGYDYHDDLRVVDAVIKRLRAKLRQVAPDAEWIVTVRSVIQSLGDTHTSMPPGRRFADTACAVFEAFAERIRWMRRTLFNERAIAWSQ
jgi:hypothetical protein